MDMTSIKRYFVPENGSVLQDSLSGLTVSLALVPEAIAFALIAGVSPHAGLYAAFFLCTISALIGGRPGMISGATGAMAVVMVALVADHKNGVELLFAAVILTGFIQILAGLLKLGKFVRMLPKPVMVGFVNGLAIVIFISQFAHFKHMDAQGQLAWLHGQTLYWMIALVIFAMIITHYLPMLTKKIPSALTSIVVVTLIVGLLKKYNISLPDVGHMMQGAAYSGFPALKLPTVAFAWKTLEIIAPYSIVLAIIGLSETLMTLSILDERTQTHGKSNRECIAQGVANIVSGGFQSMGGCAMIGQSMINFSSGGRGRLSGILAGVLLLIFVLFAWPLINIIPLAALVGVMFMVVIETFEWATFKFIHKIPLKDAFIIVTVTAATVIYDLAVAVVIGVIIASLVFAWETAKSIYTDERVNEKGIKEYVLHGPLFFASVTQFKQLFNFEQDPKEVIIDFQYSRVTDQSAIDAIKWITGRYTQLNKVLHLRHLNKECKELLGKAGELVELNVMEDPDYHVATNLLD